jgi:endo-1,3-1,4-beta-glycanase ExoK
MVRLLAISVVLLACAFSAPAWGRTDSAAAAPVVHEQGFVDRFEAPAFHPRWQISDGWSSGEWPSVEWRRSQVGLAAPGFRFAMAPAPEGTPRPYLSGEISTHEEFLYGYFESRLRIPRGGGLVGAFFTFTRPDGNETWNEIDMEFLGRDPHRLELVYHVAGEATLQVLELPFDAAEDFHTYAFEWRPNRIRWYIDNRLVHTSRGGRVGELNRPQRMFASLWNSERMPRWLGPIDRGQAPWEMTVLCLAHAPRYQGRSLCVD